MASFFIIIPTFNSALYLERCLASVFLMQELTGHAVHVHIQDNMSTDATPDIAKAWESRRVTLKSEKDSGLYDAVARGSLHLQPGQIMTWLGSDDVLLPGALATVASIFEEHQEISWLSSPPFVGSDAEGNYTPSLTVRFSQKDLAAGLHDGRSLPFVMQEGTFWRSELWIRAGGISSNYRFAGDWDLWRRFAQITPLYMLSFPIARFSMREGQVSSNMDGYYREVDSNPSKATDLPDVAYRLTRQIGQEWKIKAEGGDEDIVAGCFSLIGFDKLEGPYPESKIPKIRWALGPSAKITIKSGCNPQLARFRVGTWFEGQTIRISVGDKIVAKYEIPQISRNAFCFTEILVDVSNRKEGDDISLSFSAWQRDGNRPISVMLSALEDA